MKKAVKAILNVLSYGGIEVESARRLADIKKLDPIRIFLRKLDMEIYNGDYKVPIRLFFPDEKMEEHGAKEAILFFHGGGWTTESVETYDRVCARMAQSTGQIVVSVEYRLAPEHRFPTGLEDCYAAAQAMLRGEILPEVTPEYQQMLEECESYIQKIHQCNLDLPGEVITAKLSRLETVVTRILEEAKKRPKEAAALRKFMDYYMPTTWKLLDAYRSFENEPIQSDNILRTKKEIEDTLDTINAAFEKLLDDLFQTTAWDISSDISVLQTMLAQEGLTNQAGPSKQDIEPLHM